MSEELFQRIQSFTVEQTNCKPREVALETRLAHDLGIEGDDADEFMTEFFERFEVDPTGYNFHRHFYEEGSCGCLFFLLPVYMLLNLWGYEESSKEPITIADLIEAATIKRWPERLSTSPLPDDAPQNTEDWKPKEGEPPIRGASFLE